MLFTIDVLGEPNREGVSSVIERRTHTGPNIEEALKSAQQNLRGISGAYSFLMRNHKTNAPVGRWTVAEASNEA